MQITDCFSSEQALTLHQQQRGALMMTCCLPCHCMQQSYISGSCAQLKASSACTDSAVVILQVPLAAAPAQQPASNSSLPPGISCQGSGSDQVGASHAVRLNVPECKSLALCQTSHA